MGAVADAVMAEKPLWYKELVSTGQSDVIVIHGSSEYGPPHVSREAEADWVERESQPEYRVTANFTDEYRHQIVRATAERLRKASVDSSKPAICGQPKPAIKRRRPRPVEFYFVASSVRKSVCTLVRQLRGPHLSTCA